MRWVLVGILVAHCMILNSRVPSQFRYVLPDRGRELNLENFLYHKITCTFRQVSSGKNKVGEGSAECCGKVL